jgi:hypothetical protein
LRTALCEPLKFLDRIQRTFAGQCGLQETLCEQIGYRRFGAVECE